MFLEYENFAKNNCGVFLCFQKKLLYIFNTTNFLNSLLNILEFVSEGVYWKKHKSHIEKR